MAETTAVDETPIYQEVREALGDPWLPVEADGRPIESGPETWTEEKPG